MEFLSRILFDLEFFGGSLAQAEVMFDGQGEIRDGERLFAVKDVFLLYGGGFTPEFRCGATRAVIRARQGANAGYSTLVFSENLLGPSDRERLDLWARGLRMVRKNISVVEDPDEDDIVPIVIISFKRTVENFARVEQCLCELQVTRGHDIGTQIGHLRQLADALMNASEVLRFGSDPWMRFVSNFVAERAALARAVFENQRMVSDVRLSLIHI